MNLLVERYRPVTLNDIVLSDEQREFFVERIKHGEIPHLLFISSPGTGKTSLAKILVAALGCSYRYLNASDERGIDSIREKVIGFAQTKSIDGKLKVVILDEMDGLTGDAQRALRNVMEEYQDNIRFILTANYKNRIIEPIRSRSIIFILNPPFNECVRRAIHVIKQENIVVTPEQRELLGKMIQLSYPDIRTIISNIDKFTINGELKIQEGKTYTFVAEKIFNMVCDKHETVTEIRKYTIENEIEFNSDYSIILKGLFEHVFSIVTDEQKKRDALLVIGKHLESHQQVMDFEINAFCCIIQLKKILE
jgi:replication factor C small subunit